MTSQHWDAVQARAYHEFRYQFPEKELAGHQQPPHPGKGKCQNTRAS